MDQIDQSQIDELKERVTSKFVNYQVEQFKSKLQNGVIQNRKLLTHQEIDQLTKKTNQTSYPNTPQNTNSNPNLININNNNNLNNVNQNSLLLNSNKRKYNRKQHGSKVLTIHLIYLFLI